MFRRPRLGRLLHLKPKGEGGVQNRWDDNTPHTHAYIWCYLKLPRERNGRGRVRVVHAVGERSRRPQPVRVILVRDLELVLVLEAELNAAEVDRLRRLAEAEIKQQRNQPDGIWG